MTLGNQVPDKTLLKQVERKLIQKSVAGVKVNAAVRSGDATITGTIRNEHERKAILRCVASVPGVRRVVDQITVVVWKNPNH